MHQRPRLMHMGSPLPCVVLGASAVLFTGCNSSSISTVGPSGAKCQVSATTSQTSFASSGGSGTVGINTQSDCTWSVSAGTTWISMQGPSNGQGAASVPFAVQANPAPTARSGSIVVTGSTLSVSQAAAPCTFTLGSTQASVGAAGGPLSVAVSTLAGCNWKASSGSAWISVQSGAAGSGPASVGLAVAVNSGAARVGTVDIAGVNYTVAQAASMPPPPINLSGSISILTGKCPAVSFDLGAQPIAADGQTTFTHGTCSDLRNGTSVSVTGLAEADGTVLATTIAIEKD